MDYQTIIETFFTRLGRFDFDQAKSYIDGRKDVLQKLAPTFPNQLQLMTMLTTFSHLADVEKNYHNQPFLVQQTHHSFLPTASFLRKAKSLKDTYKDIKTELEQLLQQQSIHSNSNNSSSNSLIINDSGPFRGSGYEPPPNSTTTTPVTPNVHLIKDFSEELMTHFCKQLQNFIQARMDMIDVYEQLTEASAKKYASVDGIAYSLSMLCRQYHKDFHHPLLAPIKDSMTHECECLMTLIRATIDMQHWRFLPTLFELQDAQTKLNYWAANTFNKEASKRRFKVSKTLPTPRLYEWLCRFKEFLIAKFTLYFHDTLSKSFPLANFKSACSKLSIDYYAKLSNLQRKVEAQFLSLMYDVSEGNDSKDSGYKFPSQDSHPPQGKNSLQSMVVIPAEARAKLSSLQAEVYMLVQNNHNAMLKEGYYQYYDITKKLTYSISKPDSYLVLVIVCEGQKSDRDAQIRAFSFDLASQFSFSTIFTS